MVAADLSPTNSWTYYYYYMTQSENDSNKFIAEYVKPVVENVQKQLKEKGIT